VLGENLRREKSIFKGVVQQVESEREERRWERKNTLRLREDPWLRHIVINWRMRDVMRWYTSCAAISLPYYRHP